MKLEQIVDKLALEVFSGRSLLNWEVTGGYLSDLLSDVMGNAERGELWVTLQAHLNVVAIASLKELPAVILVKGIRPEEHVIARAEAEGVVLLGSSFQAFETAGRLYELLKRQ